MRVIGKVEAGFRIRGAAARVDPERTDLPIGRDRSHQEEEDDQAKEEKEEAELPPALALFRQLLFRLRLDGTPEWESHPAPHATAGRLRHLFRAWSHNHGAVTALSQEIYKLAATSAISPVASPCPDPRAGAGADGRRSAPLAGLC